METLSGTITGFRISDYFIGKEVLHTAQQGVQERDKEGGRQAEWKELDGESPEAPPGKRRKTPSARTCKPRPWKRSQLLMQSLAQKSALLSWRLKSKMWDFEILLVPAGWNWAVFSMLRDCNIPLHLWNEVGKKFQLGVCVGKNFI